MYDFSDVTRVLPASASDTSTNLATIGEELDLIAAALADRARDFFRSTAAERERAQALMRISVLVEDHPTTDRLKLLIGLLDDRLSLLDALAPVGPSNPPKPAEIPTTEVAGEPAVGDRAEPSGPGVEVTAEAHTGTASPAAEAAPSGPLPDPIPTPPARPPWDPRPLEELETELEGMRSELDGSSGHSLSDLARFKGLIARFRSSRRHRERHASSQDAWKKFDRALRDRQREHWANCFLIPLADLSLEPDEWQEIAGRFYSLAEAEEALDWIETQFEASALSSPKEAESCLESVAAVCNQLYRRLARIAPPHHDDQQHSLYDRLITLGRQHAIFIRSLQGEDRVQDTELAITAGKLAQHLKQLQERLEKRVRCQAALDLLHAYLARPDWQSDEDAAESLAELAADCLTAGVPVTDKRLRDPLLEYAWAVEEDPRLERLLKAVDDENQRLERKATVSAARTKPGIDQDPLLNEVLPHTRGKRGVLLGGVPRDESRREIREGLGLSVLNWPQLEESDPPSKMLQAIGDAELVFLTRFNRKKSREVYRYCREHGLTLIALPAGYGVNQVAFRVREKCAGRAPA